jgi:transposase
VPTEKVELAQLPDDSESLKLLLRNLLLEHQREKQRANQLHVENLRQQKRADELYLEKLRLEQELVRLKKLYCGPRADRLESEQELAQALLDFALELERKPIHPDNLLLKTNSDSEPEYELRRVKKRPGRRALANFDHLPVTTHVHELKPEERACPCCGQERKEIGAETSWQVEYLPGRFERIEHVRKKYACAKCESQAENPKIEVAAKPETAIAKGLAGPGLLAFIVTSKFADYVPLYRLEDIFERQGFEISRATQSIWCGDVADLVEPLYQVMAKEVRKSHVVATDETTMPMLNPGQTHPARMWVYVGDQVHPYNVFDFTLSRGRDGPKHFLKDYNQVLLADAYGGVRHEVDSTIVQHGSFSMT